MKTYVLAALVCAAALHGESAQAQQVGARQWFANANQKCLYQFDGRNWLNTRNCQSLGQQVQQQVPLGTVQRFKVGNQHCAHTFNEQRKWVNIGNCAQQITPQQRAEDQELSRTMVQVHATVRQLTSTPEGQAALAAYKANIEAQNRQAAYNRSMTPSQAQKIREFNAEVERNNQLAVGVVTQGMAANTMRQMNNDAAARADRAITANSDRQAADRARLRGQSNAGSLDARARQSDGAR